MGDGSFHGIKYVFEEADFITFVLVYLVPSVILLFILLRLFPSLPYLARQLIIRTRKLFHTGSEIPSANKEFPFSYTKLDPAGRNLEFIYNLTEIGSPEFERLYKSKFVIPNEATKSSNDLSRILSSLIALSIFLAYWIFNPLTLADLGFLYSTSICLADWLLLMIWVSIAFTIETRLRKGRIRRIQTDQDRLAADFSRILQADEFQGKALPQHFCLYLRPFITTNKITIGEMDLETILAYCLSRISPMIALGHPGEHIGAGRIKTTDEHWQEEITRLIDKANLIFIVPSHREGTLWEIKNLAQEKYLSKTIFIMPPNILFEGEAYEQQWAKALEAAKVYGLQIPPYTREGLFFRMNSEGAVERKSPLGVEEAIINLHGPN
jgi:hypothetical protein